MPWFVVVLSDPLADLTGGDADHRIQVGVVSRIPAEHFNAQGSFLQVLGLPGKRSLDNKAQHVGIALAVLEKRVGQNLLELLPNRVSLGIGFWDPCSFGRTLLFKSRSLRTTTPSPGPVFIISPI